MYSDIYRFDVSVGSEDFTYSVQPFGVLSEVQFVGVLADLYHQAKADHPDADEITYVEEVCIDNTSVHIPDTFRYVTDYSEFVKMIIEMAMDWENNHEMEIL